MQKWLDIVDRDIDVAEWLQVGGRWLYVAFECHQALEKTIKAYWCGTRDDDPPYIHDHNRLLELCGLAEKMSDEQRVAATLNELTCKDIVEQTKQFRQWILQEYSAATKPSSSSDATSK